jgi:formylglycine-generating enzyme required for sulfatase activity
VAKNKAYNTDKQQIMLEKEWIPTAKMIGIGVCAVLWLIIFLAILQPHKRWGQEGEFTASETKPPPEPRLPASVSNFLGMKFVLIPEGTFMMGSPPDEAGRYEDRETAHQVTLSKAFYMQTTEVTQGQWGKVMGNAPSYFSDCGADCPVEQVSWNDAQRFIWKVNQTDRMNKYSLPTEAQWEYACRAGTDTTFNWGNAPDCTKANYGVAFIRSECKGINPGKTVKTGSFPQNNWGLHDMHGNVAEWCTDRFEFYPSKNATDPVGAYTSLNRVYRGGSWSVISRYCRSANRDEGDPNQKFSDVGFRLVMDAEYVKRNL